jgi:myo-inositol-1(or 4)-monophosphatase
MGDVSIQAMLELTRQLASRAAEVSLTALGQATTRRKPDNSLVTETDYAIQELILGAVGKAYPDHAVVAEETMSKPGAHADPVKARYCWVVDPLDGTRNYIAGFPCFATSIAVLDRGLPIVAVVAEHNLGQQYAGARGGGATLNDRPIRVAEPEAGGDYLVGLPSSKDALTKQVIRRWLDTPGLICRNIGSSALHLALVASGALAGAFATQVKIWDLAAGALLVTEAGGRFTDPTGRDYLPFALDADPDKDLPFLAAPPNMHQRLAESIRAIAP